VSLNSLRLSGLEDLVLLDGVDARSLARLRLNFADDCRYFVARRRRRHHFAFDHGNARVFAGVDGFDREVYDPLERSLWIGLGDETPSYLECSAALRPDLPGVSA
jgi:hypothetical protein